MTSRVALQQVLGSINVLPRRHSDLVLPEIAVSLVSAKMRTKQIKTSRLASPVVLTE